MDTLLSYYFEIFDTEIEKSEGKLTPKMEININEIKEKLKDTFILLFDQTYTEKCHEIDKKFDEYILGKQN